MFRAATAPVLVEIESFDEQQDAQSELFAELYVPALQHGVQYLRYVTTPVSYWANFIIQHRIEFEAQSEYCWLTKLTPRQFGFTVGYDLREFYECVLATGRRLLPAGTAPLLRVLYLDQPEGEGLKIAMNPVPDSAGGLTGLALGHHRKGNGLWLDDWRWHPEQAHLMSVDTPWLFAL